MISHKPLSDTYCTLQYFLCVMFFVFFPNSLLFFVSFSSRIQFLYDCSQTLFTDFVVVCRVLVFPLPQSLLFQFFQLKAIQYHICSVLYAIL